MTRALNPPPRRVAKAEAAKAEAAKADAGKADAAERRTAATLDELDPLLQHRSRLGTMVLLGDADAISFVRLRDLLAETDGNLGAQLRRLEEAGHVSVRKAFEGRKPVSWYAITPGGRAALKRHLAAMESLIRSAKA